jgi:hypothetical protein
VGRDRAVVDDAAATRILRFHDAKRFLSTKKRTRKVGADDGAPLFEAEVLQGNRRRADAGIIEQDVQAAELFLDTLE